MKERIAVDKYSKALLRKVPEDVLAEELGEKYTDYRKRWHDAQTFKVRTPFPIHLDIELSYKCNLKCIMCPYGDPTYVHPAYKGQSLDTSRIKEIIKEGVPLGLSALRYNGLSEPLLEKSLVELIRYAKENGILDIFLTTNGMLLNKKMAIDLIESGLTHIMVSIDAATAETYNKIRVGGNYERVVKNVNRFLEIRENLGSQLPVFRLTYTKMQPNIGEVNAFVDMWKDKVDHIAIAGYLNNIQNKEQNDNLACTPLRPSAQTEFHCWQPWSRCTIFSNGDVFPCCMNYGRSTPVGNIFKEDLTSIWQSDRVRFIQDINRKGEYFKDPTCKACVSKRDIFEA
ncbi:MAG: radical SAM protein [Proteobacteria bacterium]|nr:radical SAM protein [Pseudomonadota bacterium]MBU1389472.1 radical SAM protein [Pseudomonadota bacterium]MBU1541292.1 radical SAM protein [Pseudomonadota bacterium]